MTLIGPTKTFIFLIIVALSMAALPLKIPANRGVQPTKLLLKI